MASNFTSSGRTDSNPYAEGEECNVRASLFPRRSKLSLVLGISIATIVLVIGLFVVAFGVSIADMGGKASVAMGGAKEFLSAAKAGDTQKLTSSANKVSDSAKEIQDELNQPIWEFASRLPLVGQDVDDIRTLSVILMDFSDNALKPMAQSGNITALGELIQDNSINAKALPGILRAINEALPALDRAAGAMKSMPRASIGPVRKIMDNATETITAADDAVNRMRPLFTYLPGLLGADGEPKHYLVLAENTAEIHAIGGFVGAIGILSVENGKMKMEDFSALTEVLGHVGEAAGATQESIKAFGDRCSKHTGDFNVIPDFSRVGQLYFNTWNIYQELEVNGVIAVDPVFLQYLLGAVGEITTSDGITLDGTNAASILLNQCLFWWEPQKCDEFYSEVAKKTLSKLFGDLDNLDATKFLEAISKAADEERLLVWAHDEMIESALKEAKLAGALGHDPAKPVLGSYVSDLSISKASYFLSMDAEVGEARLNDDGSQSYDVRVTLTNNCDIDKYDNIPSYMKVGVPGRSENDLYEEYRLLAPEGGRIDGFTVDRENTRSYGAADEAPFEVTYQGLQVIGVNVRIDSLESVVFSFTVTTSPEAEEELTVRKTPLMPEEIAYWNQKIDMESVKK